MMERFPVYCRKKILIAGVGNRLFGDDGFGPEVIDHLNSHYAVPDHVCLMDAGTGIRKILFTLTLSDVRPEIIVVIDAVDKGKKPGDIFDISLDQIPEEKIDDFSIHQVPSSNLLLELQNFCSVSVVVKVCQIERIPDTIQSGLSAPVKMAVPLMAGQIAEAYF